MTIAGHIMTDTPSGRACSVCGRTWRYMLDNRDRWRAGQLEIAHYGALNEREERGWGCHRARAEVPNDRLGMWSGYQDRVKGESTHG